MAVKQLNSNTKILGLQTNPSMLNAPPGSTQIADNVFFNRVGMAEGRRGFNYHTNHSSKIDSLIEYQGHVVICEHDGSVSINDPATATATAVSGVFNAPAGSVNRGVDARSNLYLTTATGVKKLAGLTGVFRGAGMPPGLDLEAATTGATGFLAASKAVNYRLVWSKTDSNGVAVRGAPSPLTKLVNGGATSVNATIKFSVPQTIQSGDAWELYRSAAVASSSEPSDDLYLVKTGTWSSGKEITVTDDLLEDYLITPLYTNAEDDGGIIRANWIIPLAHEIETFKDYVYLGRTTTNWFKELKLISVTGLTDNSSNIVITSGATNRTYTFSTAEDFTNNKFKRTTSGTPSQNIEATAKSLCRCINQDASGKWWATYISSVIDDPGIIQIISRDLDASSFSLVSNYGSVFDPTLPSSGTTIVSTRDEKKNRIHYSKIQQPEHFSLVDYIDVGRSDKEITGIRALKDSLFIVKTDGIFYLSGGNPNSASLVTLDSTTFCVAPKTITKLNNDLYFLSNQGVVRVSENGASVISNEIENHITELLFYPNINISIGGGIERDRLFILWVPSDENDTVPQLAYCYNIFTQQWSRLTKSASAALNIGNNFLIGSGDENAVLKMRDTRTSSDYADEEIDVTIVSITDDTGVITYSYAHKEMTAGFTLHQNGHRIIVNEIISKSGNDYTVRFNGAANVFVAGPATVLIPIDIHVRHLPFSAIHPGITKTWLDYSFVLDLNTVSKVTLTVVGNENGSVTETVINRTPDAGFGETPFGFGLFGSPGTERSVPIRENVPVQHSQSEWLIIGIKHSVAGERFALVYSNITYQVSTDVTAIVDVSNQ